MNEHHMLELGERAATELRAENYGLLAQRSSAISGRHPWLMDWILVYEGDICVRMEWGWVKR